MPTSTSVLSFFSAPTAPNPGAGSPLADSDATATGSLDFEALIATRAPASGGEAPTMAGGADSTEISSETPSTAPVLATLNPGLEPLMMVRSGERFAPIAFFKTKADFSAPLVSTEVQPSLGETETDGVSSEDADAASAVVEEEKTISVSDAEFMAACGLPATAIPPPPPLVLPIERMAGATASAAELATGTAEGTGDASGLVSEPTSAGSRRGARSRATLVDADASAALRMSQALRSAQASSAFRSVRGDAQAGAGVTQANFSALAEEGTAVATLEKATLTVPAVARGETFETTQSDEVVNQGEDSIANVATTTSDQGLRRGNFPWERSQGQGEPSLDSGRSTLVVSKPEKGTVQAEPVKAEAASERADLSWSARGLRALFGAKNTSAGTSTLMRTEVNASAVASLATDASRGRFPTDAAGVHVAATSQTTANPADALPTDGAAVVSSSEAASQEISIGELVGVDRRQTLPASRSRVGERASEKIAVRVESLLENRPADQASVEIGSKKTYLATDDEVVTDLKPDTGTEAAMEAASMPKSLRFHLSADARAEISSVAAASEGAAGMARSEAAPVQASSAVQAIRQIADAADVLWATDRPSVDLRLKLDDVGVAVRVEYRDGEVKATFHAASPEMRDALERAWQFHAAAVIDQKPYRWSEPTFTSSAPSVSSSDFLGGQHQFSSGGDSSRHSGNTASQESWTGSSGFSRGGSGSASGGSSGSASTDSFPTAVPAASSLRLQAFA